MGKHKHDPSVIPFRTSGGFERKLCRHGVLIECRCVDRGFRFIGSVSHKLPSIERIHVSECKKRLRSAKNSTSDCRTLKVRKAHA